MRRYWPLSVFIIIFVYVLIAPGSDRTSSVPPDNSTADTVERIISLAPSITETLYAIGLEDKLVAVTEFCRYPPQAQDKARVGAYLDPNIEAIVSQQPDLVILLDRHQRVIQQLQQLGIATLAVDHISLDGILDSINQIGERTGSIAQAQALHNSLQQRIDTIAQKTAGQPRPQVMLAIAHAGSDAERLGNVYIAGQQDFYNDLLQLSGADNSFQDQRIRVPSLNVEGILRLNPDIIIDLYPEAGQHPTDIAVMRRHWQALHQLKAIQQDRLYLVEAGYTVIPGPRVVDLLEHMARLIHPQLQWTTDAD